MWFKNLQLFRLPAPWQISSEALAIVGKHAVIESHEISADDFARDFAPFINIMAHHGVAPYAKARRKKK